MHTHTRTFKTQVVDAGAPQVSAAVASVSFVVAEAFKQARV